jgi:hypothetical protein
LTIDADAKGQNGRSGRFFLITPFTGTAVEIKSIFATECRCEAVKFKKARCTQKNQLFGGGRIGEGTVSA